MVRSIKKPFSKMKLLLSQINYSSAGKNYIENRLAVKLIMFWAMCLLLALPWSVSLWPCSHQPWISTPHLLGIMCWVLLLATWHEFPNIVEEMWDLGRAPQGTFAYVDGWQNTRVPPAPSKQGEADFAEGISTPAPSGLMCGHTGRRKGIFFVCTKVSFSLRVWSFSGSAASEAAANNLRNSGHISLVPSALI